jgi:hypothetical protein
LSTRRPASIGLRLLAAFTGIVGLEVVRYFAYRPEYQADPSLWFLIAVVALLTALAPLISPR